MDCKDCKLVCAAKAEPQNAAMGEACGVLIKRCKRSIPPVEPMDWLREYAEGHN